MYSVFVDDRIRGYNTGFTCGKKLTLHEAKEMVSFEFERHPSYDYAEIVDRDNDQVIYRTRWDSNYKIKEDSENENE